MRKQKTAIRRDIREKVLKRDGYRCRYCGSYEGPFHMDHVYPESKGGETTVKNLVTSCKRCNFKKHNIVGMWPMPQDHWEKTKRLERLDVFEMDGARIRSTAKGIMFLGFMIATFVPMVWSGGFPSTSRDIYYVCALLGMLFILVGYTMFVSRKKR